jgi:nicotinamidase-related amidase
MFPLDPKASALILIDLQRGILATPILPHPTADLLPRASALAGRFRDARAPVFAVHVVFSADFADAPKQPVDQPAQWPPGGLPSDWSDFAEGIAAPGDIIIAKRQWGAFHGTELELQLRRRGVRTIVLGGVATNFGVESTARQAWELGFEVVIAEDICASRSAELHDFTIRNILPRCARVTTSAEIAFTS